MLPQCCKRRCTERNAATLTQTFILINFLVIWAFSNRSEPLSARPPPLLQRAESHARPISQGKGGKSSSPGKGSIWSESIKMHRDYELERSDWKLRSNLDKYAAYDKRRLSSGSGFYDASGKDRRISRYSFVDGGAGDQYLEVDSSLVDRSFLSPGDESLFTPLPQPRDSAGTPRPLSHHGTITPVPPSSSTELSAPSTPERLPRPRLRPISTDFSTNTNATSPVRGRTAAERMRP